MKKVYNKPLVHSVTLKLHTISQGWTGSIGIQYSISIVMRKCCKGEILINVSAFGPGFV